VKNTSIFLLKKLLKAYTIKLDEKELEFQLLSHPSFPSLHSLTGVLDHFKIENVALEVPNNLETLSQMPKVFIAYIKKGKSDDLVLATIADSQVTLIYNDKIREVLSLNQFCEIWSGIFIAIEKDNEVISKSKVSLKGLRALPVLLTLLALITLFFTFKPGLFQSIHFLLSFIGFGVSIIIVKHELGLYSRIADKVCSGNYKKINCDEVLKSKAASFLGFIKLSDIGIVYFISMILSWMLIIISGASNTTIILITILALPFTLYSVSYQYFIVKKWCVLCLSIVLILWLQAFSLYYSDFKFNQVILSPISLKLIVVSVLFSIVAWQFILPRLKKEQAFVKLKIEHFKFKRNFSLFKALQSVINPINTTINGIQEIQFGNNPKFLHVIIITNPLCGYCRETHALVEKLLERTGVELQVTIRFNVSLKEESIDTSIAHKLFETYNAKGEKECLNAMHDIYGKLNPTDWFKKWGEPSSHQYIESLSKQKQWCVKSNINFTPEILVNDKAFPKEYERLDLLYFLDDIIEDVREETLVLIKEEV